MSEQESRQNHPRSPSSVTDLDASGTPVNVPDRLLTVEEVAALLAVPVRWVREHTRSGLIPHVALGRYRRYDREDVLRWVEEQKAGGAAWRLHRPRS
jgi:excisionase family DNA binding protein